jgi:hypothetical protein
MARLMTISSGWNQMDRASTFSNTAIAERKHNSSDKHDLVGTQRLS